MKNSYKACKKHGGKRLEIEVIISKEYVELIEKRAAEEKISIEKFLENAIRKFIERKRSNGRQ